MVSAIRSIIDRINGQRSSVIGHSQPTATNDQQGVHLFFDAASPEKHVFPGLILFYGNRTFPQRRFPDIVSDTSPIYLRFSTNAL